MDWWKIIIIIFISLYSIKILEDEVKKIVGRIGDLEDRMDKLEDQHSDD